jgi:hypothetical protein
MKSPPVAVRECILASLSTRPVLGTGIAEHKIYDQQVCTEDSLTAKDEAERNQLSTERSEVNENNVCEEPSRVHPCQKQKCVTSL